MTEATSKFDLSQYVSRASFVVAFLKDVDMRYKSKEIEQYFREIAASQSVATNVPDQAPEQMPRITMQSGSKTISVSQTSAQLDFDFSESHEPIADSMSTIERNVLKFWEGVEKLRGRTNMRQAGLVVTVCTPSLLSLTQIHKSIFDRYIRIQSSTTVASVGFRVGFLDEERWIFRNYGLDGYELREGTIDQSQVVNGQLKIQLASIPVRESGFELKMDINSLPLVRRENGAVANHADIVVSEMRRVIESKADGLLAITEGDIQK